jgi:hypothetical protein
MVKGLGITIRVLLDLLPETLRRCERADRGSTGSRPMSDGSDRRACGADRAANLFDLLAAFRAALKTTPPRGADRAQVVVPRGECASARADPSSLTCGATASGAAGSDRHAVGGAASDTRETVRSDELNATARALADAERTFLERQAAVAADVERALDANDGERARALVDRQEQDAYLPFHDRLVRFMAAVFGWVLDAGGPAELLTFHADTAEGQRRGFERWDAMSAEDFARTTAFLLRQHMGGVAVREDDEKLTIEQTPCGSGGRLRLAGAYEGRDALPMVESAGPLTLGQPRFPVYCSHCPIWNGLAPIRWFGRPHWVFDEPSRADGSCTLHIYKSRDGAPRDYWRRLGLSRDER